MPAATRNDSVNSFFGAVVLTVTPAADLSLSNSFLSNFLSYDSGVIGTIQAMSFSVTG